MTSWRRIRWEFERGGPPPGVKAPVVRRPTTRPFTLLPPGPDSPILRGTRRSLCRLNACRPVLPPFAYRLKRQYIRNHWDTVAARSESRAAIHPQDGTVYQAPGCTTGGRYAWPHGLPRACSAGVILQLHHHSTSFARPVGLMPLPDPTVSRPRSFRRTPS